MEEIDVPCHFLCPISMQLMRDPVTVSTGITYDRESIERWLFLCKNDTCPATKQVLYGKDLTPNHTLRRLIQAWCTLNASSGIERIPTPKPPVDKTQIVKLLNEAHKFPRMQKKCLQRLRSVVQGNQSDKKCLEEAGAIEFLAYIIKTERVISLETPSRPESHALAEVPVEDGVEFVKPSDEALYILYLLKPSETGLKNFSRSDGTELVESLMHVLKCESYQSRAYAMMLLKSIFNVADPAQFLSVKAQLFREIVQVLRDKISEQASKAAMKFLIELCPWGKNRIKAVEAGAVGVLIELLIDNTEKRACECILIVLDQLCNCAEGRAELLKHGAGLAIVSKKILRVSHVASGRAVRILSSISKYSATSRVLQEMLQIGVVSKLCLVVQVDSNPKTKERAKEILRSHSRVLKDSSCIPAHLLSSYPS